VAFQGIALVAALYFVVALRQRGLESLMGIQFKTAIG
jgi:hypothetical protein